MNTRQKLKIILTIFSISIIFGGLRWEYYHINHEKNLIKELCFTEKFDNVSVDFKVWEATEDGIYYLIIPAAFQEDDAEFEVKYNDFFYQIYIDGKLYGNQSIWKESLQEQLHNIQVVDIFGEVHADKQIQVLKSGELPVMMVTVEAKDELYDNTDYDNKNYIEKGELLFWGTDGELILGTTLDVFKVRGNLTAELPKKPFSFELSEPASLCGMEEAINWNLLANLTDGSNIRNKIMLDWANEVSDSYEAGAEFVELFLNGEYQGLYLLTEAIEMGENRLEYQDGGMLMEMELDYRREIDKPSVQTDKGHTFVMHVQDYMTDEDIADVEDYLNEIESALYAVDGIGQTSRKKLSELIDLDSWTDAWLLREISADHDLGVVSQFAYVENWEGRSILKAGPEWDFDGTFGNAMVPLFRNPRSLVAAMVDTKGIKSNNQNKWFAPMYENEEFREMLVSKFEHEYTAKIEKLVNYEIDEYIKKIDRSALIDSLRWNSDGRHNYIYPPEEFYIPAEGDYHKYDIADAHAQMIKDFLLEKKQFLQELWIEEVTFEVLVEEHYEDGMNLELNNNVYTWVRKE